MMVAWSKPQFAQNHMVRPRLHRLTAFLLLSAYTVATIAGGLLHHHDHTAGQQHSEHCQHGHAGVHEHGHAGVHGYCRADHDEHIVDHGFADHRDCEHEAEAFATTSETGHSLFDDDCSACRFVGQRTLATAPVSAAGFSTHSVELTLRHPSQTAVSLILARHSRAPPALG